MTNRTPNAQIPSARPKRNKFTFNNVTVSTSQFFELYPETYITTIPDESIEIEGIFKTLSDSLTLPTFGLITQTRYAYFVPYRAVWKAWKDHKANTLHTYSNGSMGIPAKKPVIGNNEIVKCFQNHNMLTATTGTADVTIVESGVTNTYTFTTDGKKLLKILQGLGYQVIWNDANKLEMNALKLMAFAKIFLEQFYPKNYEILSIYTTVKAILDQDTGPIVLSEQQLYAIYQLIQNTSYDQDYFTSAFENENMPFPGSYEPMTEAIDANSNTSFAGTTANIGNSTSNDSENNPVIARNGTSGSLSFSQKTILFLQNISAYFKRFQLSGNSADERMRAKYGNEREQNSIIRLGEINMNLNIDEIMSNSDTLNPNTNEGSSLGAYAGKGEGRAKGVLKLEPIKEHGVIIIVNLCMPHISYYQGIDRDNLALTCFDDYTEEFDAMGCQAIASLEAYVGNDGTMFQNNAEKFGYTQMYGNYKVGHDLLLGDFRVKSAGAEELSAFHLFRDLSNQFSGTRNKSFGFVRGTSNDRHQYLRIFGLGKELYEPFRNIAVYSITKWSNMRKYYDDQYLDQLAHQSDQFNEFQVGGINAK